jgi:hypothetical protein
MRLGKLFVIRLTEQIDGSSETGNKTRAPNGDDLKHIISTLRSRRRPVDLSDTHTIMNCQ